MYPSQLQLVVFLFRQQEKLIKFSNQVWEILNVTGNMNFFRDTSNVGGRDIHSNEVPIIEYIHIIYLCLTYDTHRFYKEIREFDNNE